MSRVPARRRKLPSSGRAAVVSIPGEHGGVVAGARRHALVLRAGLLAVAVGYATLSRTRYFDWCIHDDAYISYRYART